MDDRIVDIYNLLQEMSWQFGDHGFNGECCGDLSLVEYMALKKILNNKDITIQEIGGALNFTKSGATRIIDRLEQKGYVLREQSSVDGRVCCVNLTSKGTKVMTEIIEKYTQYIQDLLQEFESEKIESMRDSLGDLVEAIKKKPFKSCI
ncbi:MAG: MarR family transcriptional regulator [Dehalobacter sp.]|nr:MarR family transcriptional regulator [Dehalobacter sp.]